MIKCYFKPQMHDMLPIASDKILCDSKTFACHCGCGYVLNNGNWYFNSPRQIESMIKVIKHIRNTPSILE